jgi:hypothetical protein
MKKTRLIVFIVLLVAALSSSLCYSQQVNQYDIDQNWVIGDFELLNAIDYWAIGSLGDFELLDLIDFWAGGCYHWDAVSEDCKTGCDGFEQSELAGKTFRFVYIEYPTCGEFSITFNNDFTFVNPGGGIENYTIENGSIVLQSPEVTNTISVISRNNDGSITVQNITDVTAYNFIDQTDQWGIDFSIFNNSADALKNWIVENGFWADATITSDGKVMRAVSPAVGKWWIDGNIFYFDYPEDDGCIDTKAFKLENNRLLFATDASHIELYEISPDP